jgi:hypothetical protein
MLSLVQLIVLVFLLSMIYIVNMTKDGMQSLLSRKIVLRVMELLLFA